MSNGEDDGDGFGRRRPSPGGDSEWSPLGGYDAGQNSGGAPGKRSLTQSIRAADPRAVLLAKLRTVRGQISGVRDRHLPGMNAAIESRDMIGARGAASDLGIALGTIDHELDEARRLATVLDSDGARLMVEDLARKSTDLHAEADPVLALAPPAAQRIPALAAFAVHLFRVELNANDATEAQQRRQWLARLDARKSGPNGRGALIDASSRFASKPARRAATIDKPAAYEETRATVDESPPLAESDSERNEVPQPERERPDRAAATIDKPAEYEETRATIDDSRPSADRPPAKRVTAQPDRAAATIDKPAEYEETRATIDDSPRIIDRTIAKREMSWPDRARPDRAAATIDKPAEYEETRATIDDSARVAERVEAKREARQPNRARPDRAAATIDKPAEYEETRATIDDSPDVEPPKGLGRPARAAATIDKPAEWEETRATVDDIEDDEPEAAPVRRSRGPVTIDRPPEWEETRATIAMAVQRHAQPDTAGVARDPGDIHRLAASGVSAGGGALPHRDAIQRSFGRHDVSRVRAHVGGRAAAAAGEIGADAYATGNDIAFASEPSLFTAAHEAAHTIQQQGGVSLLGGVGQAGDSYEQHADAVADRVVRGESADILLDSMAGSTGLPATGVQRQAARGPTAPHERIGQAIDDGRRAVRRVLDEFIPAAKVAYSARDFDAAGDAASSARFTMARAENEAKAARRLLVEVMEDAYRSKLELEVNALEASIAAIKPELGEVVRKAPPDRASSAPQPGFGAGPECGAEAQESWEDEASRQAHLWKGQLDADDAERFASATPAPIPNDACAIDGPRAADAFSGIALYLQVKDALKAMKATQAYDEKHVGPGHAGPYELHANTRSGEIVYYLARHAERGQVEWAIGPDSINSFVTNADIYVGAARASLPGSRNVADSQKDGAKRAEHIPSILELEAFGQAPYQRQQPDPTFELGRDSTSTIATPDLLGVEGTNGGSAMVGTRNTHLRLSEYTQEAARLAQRLKAEVDAGKLDHMQARQEAVGGRNHLMQNVREKMSPSARYSSQKIKTDKGVSVDFMTKKKTADILEASLDGGKGMEVFGEKGDAGKLRAVLAEESALWERYRGALEAGEGAQRVYAEALQELGEQPAVSRAVVNSAGKSNGMVTALAKGGRALGTAAAIYGVYEMVATIVDAEEGKRLHVAAGEMSSFAGGVVGGEAGAMAAVWLASLMVPGVGTGAVIVVSLIGGMIGGAVGANMGPGINEIAGGVAHDGMEAVMGPGMPQNGGYGGLVDRSTRSGAKAFDIEARLADTLLAMDFSLDELEQKIEAARNEQEMQAYQKARLDLLDGRHEMGTIYAALKSGAIDQGQVWDMMGERPDERVR